jgi:hypothetical protein
MIFEICVFIISLSEEVLYLLDETILSKLLSTISFLISDSVPIFYMID